jgi:hypothetical protein
VHWGAEFSAQGARLCAIAERDGKASVVHAFSGPYPEAEAFAKSHGLAYAGLHAAFSHLPFKLEPMGSAEESGEEAARALERARPQGLPAEALESHVLPIGAGACLALAREDSVQALLKALPPPLASLWDLVPSPLALLPFVDPGSASGPWAALLGEPEAIHVLFFRAGTWLAYAKVFSGWEEAGRDPAAFAREMKKALVYHFGGRFGAEPLGGLQVWRDGPGGEIDQALQGLGIPSAGQAWGPLAEVAPEFRVAAAAAWAARDEEERPETFSGPAPAMAVAQRAWLRRAGKLARYGAPAMAALGLAIALLGASALGLRWTVEAKARAWSGELRRWDEFQRRKAVVEAELGGLRGLLSRRTAVYADLQRIAGRLPAETWLEAWEAECKAGARCQHRLEGYAATESRVPEFLSALEKPGSPIPLKLKATEKIKAEVVEQKTGIAANRRELVRFQLGSAP